MNTALLLITHNNLGKSLLATATAILGKTGLATGCISVTNDSNPDTVFEDASRLCSKLDQGDGILILTDLYGSTPSNISNHLAETHNAVVISGVNIPMLLRVINYHDMPLDQLAEKAASGARDGIIETRGKQAS